MPVASVGEADELAACPEIDSTEMIKPSLIVKAEFTGMRSHPRELELELSEDVCSRVGPAV
jgi:hypothetical protein